METKNWQKNKKGFLIHGMWQQGYNMASPTRLPIGKKWVCVGYGQFKTKEGEIYASKEAGSSRWSFHVGNGKLSPKNRYLIRADDLPYLKQFTHTIEPVDKSSAAKELTKDAEKLLKELKKEHRKEGPNHYKQGQIECIDAIRSALTEEEFRGFCKGNIFKYTWREKHKNGTADMLKAKAYIDFLDEKRN